MSDATFAVYHDPAYYRKEAETKLREYKCNPTLNKFIDNYVETRQTNEALKSGESRTPTIKLSSCNTEGA